MTDFIKQMINLTGHLNPGVQECDRTIAVIQKASGEIDRSSIEVTTMGNFQNVPGAERATFSQSQNAASMTCRQLADNLKSLVTATGSAKELVAAAQNLQKTIPMLVGHVKLTAVSTNDAEQKRRVLNHTMGDLDALYHMVEE